ncbi:MAG: hypothetical protein WDM77_09675 [Steroidobacteraceae bacterium]
MRAPITILVLANLGFAAWALLIDRPADPPAARDISRLPKLVLASEPARGTGAAGSGAKDTGSGPSAVAATSTHCVTVGPFSDIATVAAASSLLQSRGFTPDAA